MQVLSRVPRGASPVALETTLLTHGVPRDAALPLASELRLLAEREGAHAVLAGIVSGNPILGLTDGELQALLEADPPKVNSANLGVALHRRVHGSTTVSATMEFCAGANVRLFSTGGIGGVHRDYARRLDISADLGALARLPVAVVSSGVKAILDVPSTREALEALGVPVVGFRTDRFPAFYLRDGGAGVDAVFESEDDLAEYISFELGRRRAGVLVVNPISAEFEIARADWDRWLGAAERHSAPTSGRDVTPGMLAQLHELSEGATLRANIALIKSNTALAARLASHVDSPAT
jgi:pseudouridine-5'-phosphate glycosidase